MTDEQEGKKSRIKIWTNADLRNAFREGRKDALKEELEFLKRKKQIFYEGKLPLFIEERIKKIEEELEQ